MSLLTLKKAWVLLKHYWYLPLAIVVALVVLLVLRKPSVALKLLRIKEDSFKKEMAIITSAEKEEKRRQAKLTAEYELALRKLDEDEKGDLRELDEEEKKKIKKLVKKHSGEELAKKFAETFDLDYVEGSDE